MLRSTGSSCSRPAPPVKSNLRDLFRGQLKLVALRNERGIDAGSAIGNLRRLERRLRSAEATR